MSYQKCSSFSPQSKANKGDVDFAEYRIWLFQNGTELVGLLMRMPWRINTPRQGW
ncbi:MULTISPECIES: hypothetical protein [Vibrio]|uniref:hypothetical protein n=1 Tax=Vibrio TaxID=662 RepID=UPI000B26AE93|nr:MULTISPECIES: hypothetical protein [Vibrio]MCF4173808.1 hypothetical protein [Vibrio sp. McD22-P3]MCG9656558.1 hypothetical protein [Vibrio mediterranei]MCY9852427.1 hypothetical protein [Vibrio mediterranei]MDA0106845.1 hypothetical protein [Vibrio sp. La 4.2.2]USE02975.1 hypothetical protein JKJ11_25395 [Vibrio sp. SCSIO 43133]